LDTAIIATGSELLAGHVADSNSKFIAEKLREIGFTVRGIYLSDDNKEDIKRMINTAFETADLIIMTGGLGPTKDDLSREAAAEALNKELIFSEEIAERLKTFFSERNYTMTKNNLRQAYLPEGAEVINNNNGTAPALKIPNDDNMIYLLPGVPREMKAIFEGYILDELRQLSDKKIICRQYNFIGIGESSLEDSIKDIDLDQRLEKSYQAAKGQVKLRLKADSKKLNEDKIRELLDQADMEIEKNFSEYIISRDDRGILEVFFDEIQKSGLSISTAESFTGGLIGERLSKLAGSSAFYKGSIVAYNNQAKINLLNIDSELLNKHGAVSSECVRAMAESSARLFDSDIAAASSGAAGPESLEGKKAGTMHLALKFKDSIIDFKLEKNYGRSLNRFYASQFLLFEIIKLLRKEQAVLL